MLENEIKQNWWPIAFVSIGCGVAAFTSFFSIYYAIVFPKIFVQMLDTTAISVSGWIGMIASILLFGLTLYLYIVKKDRCIIFGSIMLALSVVITVMSFFVQMWFLYTIAGVLCIFASLCQMFDLRRILPKAEAEQIS